MWLVHCVDVSGIQALNESSALQHFKYDVVLNMIEIHNGRMVEPHTDMTLSVVGIDSWP